MRLAKRFVVLWLGSGLVLWMGSCYQRAHATSVNDPINFRVVRYDVKTKQYIFQPMLPLALGVTATDEQSQGIIQHQALQCKAESRLQGTLDSAKVWATFLKCDHKTEFIVNGINFNYSEEP